MSKRTVILTILDGWGIGESNESNPIHVVNPPNINYIKANFPSGSLQASGISVGFPWGEEGNSEIGHLNIGAGKIIYQNYPKISLAIRDKSFFKNPAIKKAFDHAKENNSAVNVIGLLSSGNVHSSLEHLDALIKWAKEENISKLNLHIFTDGRDSSPESAFELLQNIPKENLKSLSGRFYGMDREKYWDRTEKAYKVLIGDSEMTEDIKGHLQKTYDKNYNDEYIEPILIGPKNGGIKDNDSIIFFNFRNDRIVQISSCFIDKNFKSFPIKTFDNLCVVTMTKYDDSFNTPIAFPPETIDNPLGKILSDNEKTQLRLTETQKYPHITYFFNGMKEDPFKNEDRVLVPSRSVLRQDENPFMMAPEITAKAISAVKNNKYDFILINYANGDIIAHTGNYQACLEAVKIIDDQLGELTKAALENNAVLVITSDHGNMEKVLDPMTGLTETQHNPNPVPIYLVAKEFQGQRTESEIKEGEKVAVGVLADIAPTVLELMDVPEPTEMTGQSFLKFLVSGHI